MRICEYVFVVVFALYSCIKRWFPTILCLEQVDTFYSINNVFKLHSLTQHEKPNEKESCPIRITQERESIQCNIYSHTLHNNPMHFIISKQYHLFVLQSQEVVSVRLFVQSSGFDETYWSRYFPRAISTVPMSGVAKASGIGQADTCPISGFWVERPGLLALSDFQTNQMRL